MLLLLFSDSESNLVAAKAVCSIFLEKLIPLLELFRYCAILNFVPISCSYLYVNILFIFRKNVFTAIAQQVLKKNLAFL